MRRAQIINNTVVAVMDTPDEWETDWITCPDLEVKAGWHWTGTDFQPEAPTSLPPLTARQLRLILLRKGITPSAVQAAIEQLPEQARDEALIEWEYATEYKAGHPLITQLAAAFGITEYVEDWWQEGLTL